MKSVYEKKDPNPYDLVIIDLNNPDLSTGISPGPAFFSKEFLESVKVLLTLTPILEQCREKRNDAGNQHAFQRE